MLYLSHDEFRTAVLESGYKATAAAVAGLEDVHSFTDYLLGVMTVVGDLLGKADKDDGENA